MTLRAKTSLLLALILTLFLGVTGLYYLEFLESSLKNSIFAGVDSVSETTAQSISKFLDDTLREAQAVAQALPVAALEDKDAPRVEARLKALLEVFPKFENGMFLLDADGKLWVDFPAHPEVRGRSFTFREYYKRTMKEKRGIIGVPYRSARTGEPVLTFTAFLRGSSGRELGLLGCSVQILSPNALGGIRKAKIGRSGYIYVYDSSRLMILHPEDQRVLKRDVPVGANRLFDAALKGFVGVGETVNSRGIPMLLSLRPIPGTDWIIGAQQPQSEAFAPLKEARRRILYGLMLSVFVAIFMGSVAMRRITEPLARLRRAVMRMGMEEGQGDAELQRELEGIPRGDEIGELADVFGNISRRLDQTLVSLREAASDWERTFDAVPDIIAILDKNHRIVRVNRAVTDILGKSEDELMGLKCHEVIHGTDEPPDFCPHQKMLQDGREHTAEFFEERMGRYLGVTISPLKDAQGRVMGSVHVARDITDQKRAQRAIIESERLLAKINESFLSFGSDHINNINSLTGLAGEILGATCALYNRLQDGMLYSLGQWNTPEDYDPLDRPDGHICYDVIKKVGDDILIVKDLLNTHYAETDPNVLRYSLKTYIGKVVKSRGTPTGSLCVVYQDDFEPSETEIKAFEIVASAIGVEEERKYAEEERKRLETRLQQAQKMEAIGTLAGGVAHDLNNILSGLVSYPELILLDLPEESPIRDSIVTIQESGKKAATIVQDMLTLARRGVTVRDVVNLNDIIFEYVASPVCDKLKSFHPQVRIVTDLEEGLLNILGSEVHLSKVLMNLVSNAAEAMPAGGEIVITSKNRYIDKPIHGYDDVEEGDYTVLSVSDSGIGISPEELERIFEPFYTKKVMGRSGSGLGMAVVWSTVKDHKGYIDVRSVEGEGTTFDLYFPVTRREADLVEGRVNIEDFLGSEKVLVVDDVKEQREIASRMLGKLGYSVATAASGEDAVEYLRENDADILVLDMIMDPGIDGLETYSRIIEIRPGQRAVIASGYSETERVKEAQRLGAGPYIKKPYTLEKLLVALRRELDRE